MSKKGQDNQRGISFQNKVVLLFILDSYKYDNFFKINLEGDNFEDFTLFFKGINNKASFFREFEVKNWKTPLTLNNVRDIIKKEIKKGIDRYSDNGSFCIVASSFHKECNQQIESFKKRYPFHPSNKDFDSSKKIYKKMCGAHPILDWSREEIIFLNEKLNLIEINEKSLDKQICDRFFYEQSFFYTVDNAQNIISRLFKKITEKSSFGGELTKQEIESLIADFRKAEIKKSESYDLNKDLGSVIRNIEKKLKTEDDFNSLNDDKYITPISEREQAIFSIVNTLQNRDFSFKKIRWFFDKILVKDRYMFQSLKLLKKYAGKTNLDQEEKNSILEFILKLYEYESESGPIYRGNFNRFYKDDIFEILLKLSKTGISDNLKKKIYDFLDKALPNWETTHQNYTEYDMYYDIMYRDVPEIIKTVFNYKEEAIELIFKKYDFTRSRDYKCHIYDDYIKEFINHNFKKNIRIVVKSLADQFTRLYKSYGFTDGYAGYELSGGGYFGSGNQYSLQVFKWEFLLSHSIEQYYNKHKDIDFLEFIINSPINKNNPLFLKRSVIPLLLKQLQGVDEENPKENKFYKYLASLLDIKRGLPFTEDVVIELLYRRYVHQNELPLHEGAEDLIPAFQSQESQENNIDIPIPRAYLNLIVRKILYKYSDKGIMYNIFIIQLIIQLIEVGELQFKADLRRTFLDKEFQKSPIYNQALNILAKKIKNKHIKSFFDEIKGKIDISQNRDLLYKDVAVISKSSSTSSSFEKLFNSSSKKDLDSLADIIGQAIWSNNHDFLKKLLKLMETDFSAFYKRAKVSEYLMQVIAKIPPYASSLLKNEKFSEEIIDILVKSLELFGESQELHESVAIKGEDSLSITTMRSHLCYSVNSYIVHYCHKMDDNKISFKKLEKAFLWTKTLVDLDGTLAKKIPHFPKPNYYLRYCAIIPLINLSYYKPRENLNKYKPGLGDEVKNFAFTILEQTEKEIEANKYSPLGLLNQIGRLFDVIRDLNENEVKKVLYFIKKFNISTMNHLFIYYAIFREKDPLFIKKPFNSDWFEKELEDICKAPAGPKNKLKKHIVFTIYKGIENKDVKNQNQETNKPDFDFFEKIESYWFLLFENFNKDIQFSLIRTLAFVLNRNQSYYKKYKTYFFDFIKKILQDFNSSDSAPFLHWGKTLNAVSKYAPEDLIELLFLFLEKGDPIKGLIPFHSEVTSDLIPKIKEKKNKISQKNFEKAKVELNKYNIFL